MAIVMRANLLIPYSCSIKAGITLDSQSCYRSRQVGGIIREFHFKQIGRIMPRVLNKAILPLVKKFRQ